MTIATGILWLIALVLIFFAWRKGQDRASKGLKQSWNILKRNTLLLFIAFLIVGYINVLSPQEMIQKYIGPNSGWQGLLLAEGIGMLLPGGPYVVFPLIAVIYSAGAGLAPAVTIITSWALLDLLSVSFELSIMGWRFSAVRWGLGLVVPFLLGILVTVILG
jgi:uncharacterized membrane protein YraQ (UPF0718 family)